MDLTIIIVNWNVKDFLKRCLQSVYKFTQGIEFEAFVVDNNSSDGSQDMVETEFPQVYLIANNENYGFSKANNQALVKSQGRYALLLNPDTELFDNSFRAMVEFMDAHRNIDAIGCKLLGSDGLLQTSCRRFPSLFTDLTESLYLDHIFPKSSLFNRYRMAPWPHNDFREVDHLYGACLFLRQEVFKKIGLMDERFFMYYDEIDLCYRIKKNGGKIYFVPEIKIIHHSNKSSNQLEAEVEHWKLKSRLLFFQKHYGRYSIWNLVFNLLLRSGLVLIIFPLAHLLSGRPRDIGYFRHHLKITWLEYINFLKYPGD